MLDHWDLFGETWYGQLHDIFDVAQVLQRQFKADDRVREAEAEGLVATPLAGNDGDDDASRRYVLHELFAKRVRAWRETTLEALRSDAVPAPSDPAARWNPLFIYCLMLQRVLQMRTKFFDHRENGLT